MGKKKAEAMAKEKEAFLGGAKDKKIDSKIAERVFDLMEKFAGYGFNRSHSAAYGLLTYQTAYLKRYFPVEFYAALLTCDKDDTDAVVKFISEAKSAGIAVLRPDVNESEKDFGVVESLDDVVEKGKDKGKPKKVIRFGLGAVKGVGEGAVDIVKLARDEGGPFLSIFDFCKRVDGRKVNRKVLEALCKAGAFDGVALKNGVTRARVFCAIDMASERAAEAQRERESGQTSLLSLFGGGARIKRAATATGTACSRTSTPTATSGCPRSCSRTRRSRWAFTSAATRSIASRARSSASRRRSRATASRRASAPRSSSRASSRATKSGP